MPRRKSSFNPNSVGSADLPPRTAGDGVVMTEYLVVPEGFRRSVTPDRHLWTLRVHRTDLIRDLWMVSTHCGLFSVNVNGQLVRTAGLGRRQLREWCEMPLRDAHSRAQAVVATIRVNGRTLAEQEAVVVELAGASRRHAETTDAERSRHLNKEIRALARAS